jgi:hypothetical protein
MHTPVDHDSIQPARSDAGEVSAAAWLSWVSHWQTGVPTVDVIIALTFVAQTTDKAARKRPCTSDRRIAIHLGWTGCCFKGKPRLHRKFHLNVHAVPQ